MSGSGGSMSSDCCTGGLKMAGRGDDVAVVEHRHRSALTAATVAACVAVATVLSAAVSGAEARPAAASSTTAGATTGSAVDVAHPYSDPTWFPLRTSARVRCVVNNCVNPVRHGYWALDFLGDRGDPVHAAGSGVFHVGNVNPDCSTPPGPQEEGTWAWVDHGGGIVTRYHHLASVLADEGDLVTPSTRIGSMGDTGNCKTDYLHFEVRSGGVKRDRVNPGPLSACTAQGRVSFPTDLPNGLGAASWNALDVEGENIQTGATTSSCVSVGPTPDQPVGLSGRRGDNSVQLRWPAAEPGVDRVTLSQQEFHPSVGQFGAPTYRNLPASSTTASYSNLRNGRPYRLQVSRHNENGHSAWSEVVQVTPAGAPSTPQRRWLRSDRSRVYFGWTKSDADGTPVTGYVASLRCRVGETWKSWQRVDLPSSVLHYRWENRRPGRVCQTTVQAKSSAGPSGYTPRRSVLVRR